MADNQLAWEVIVAGKNMAVTVICFSLLQGCAAPLLVAALPGLATPTFLGAKELHNSSRGGEIEVNIDESKITNDQRTQLKNIKMLAVWPDGAGSTAMLAGSSAMFAEALSEGGRFSIVTPSRVSASLGGAQGAYTYNLKMMTGSEVKEVFAKVCQETGAEAIISLKEIDQEYNQNFFSFNRPNAIHKLMARIYKKNLGDYATEIPVEIRTDFGGKINARSEEASRLIYGELAKKIIALAQ